MSFKMKWLVSFWSDRKIYHLKTISKLSWLIILSDDKIINFKSVNTFEAKGHNRE